MSGIEEMAKRIEETNRHKEVVKKLDWATKYLTSLLRAYEMEIKRNFGSNPATLSIAVYWKEPEEPKEEEKKLIPGSPLGYEEGLEKAEDLEEEENT